MSRAVVVPTRMLMRRVAQFTNWLIVRSATLLLYEMEMKHRYKEISSKIFTFLVVLEMLR